MLVKHESRESYILPPEVLILITCYLTCGHIINFIISFMAGRLSGFDKPEFISRRP